MADNPLRRALDRIMRPPLLSALAVAQLALLLVVAAAHLASLAPPDTVDEPGTGDFLAFWIGAVMLHDGDGAELYDYAAQQSVQTRILGKRAPWFQGYLNPPLLAWVLSPAVPLGYVVAFYLFCIGCVLAFLAGMLALLRELQHLAPRRADRYVALAVVTGFHPVIRTLIGGQNTPLTIALVAGLFAALRRGSWLVAGLMLGLLTYKPQYAIGLGIAVLALREFRALGVGIGIGLVHALVGALVVGWDWPLRMFQGLRAFMPLEREFNADTHFSWVRIIGEVVPAPLGGWIGAAGAVLILAAIAWAGVRVRTSDAHFTVYFALAVTATMLASPHLQYYDAGLLIVPALLLLDHTMSQSGEIAFRTRMLIAAAYVGYPVYLLADRLGFQPLFITLAAIFTWALIRTFRAFPELPQAPAPVSGRDLP